MERLRQQQVNSILAQHSTWAKTKGEFGKRGDFTNTDISGLVCHTDGYGHLWDLSGIIFHITKAANCQFQGSNLSNATLSCSDFAGSDFRGCNLFQANCLGSGLFNIEIGILPTGVVYGESHPLTPTDLWRTIGDYQHIMTLNLGGRHVNYTSELLQIGCLQFTQDEWYRFSDEDIAEHCKGQDFKFQAEAVNWWHKWKPYLQNHIKNCPATPFKY